MYSQTGESVSNLQLDGQEILNYRGTNPCFAAFSASYAGHVVDDNLGFEGLPANDRNYPNEQLASAFDWALDFSRHLESLGYDEFWMAEHHFQTEGYECIPNLLMLSLYLASNTERLKYGCGFNITPMWHPLRLAEDFAMADILTKGPRNLRRGPGLPHPRGGDLRRPHAGRRRQPGTVRGAGGGCWSRPSARIPSLTRARITNSLPTCPTRGYQLEKISLVPRPISQPVEIWQPLVSGNPKGVDFMGRVGIRALIANTPEPALGERMEMYQSAAAAHGRELALGEDTALGYRFFIGDTQEKAIEEARPYFRRSDEVCRPPEPDAA